MRFPIKSFFARSVAGLVLLVALLSGLYALFVANSIYMTEDAFAERYLERELQRIEQQVLRGEKLSLPNTSYLKSYWHSSSELPEDLREHPEGYWELEGVDGREMDTHLLIATVANLEQRVYLLLSEASFSPVNQYERPLQWLLAALVFGVVVSCALIARILILRHWQPVRSLAADVEREWHPEQPFYGHHRSDEIGVLSRAFGQQAQRLQASLAGEKAFSRHASHELRTPLAIIRNALAVLQLPNLAEQKRANNLARIGSAIDQADHVVELFLALGQPGLGQSHQQLDLAQLLEQALTEQQLLLDRHFEIRRQGELPKLEGAEILARTLLSNLLRNALTHGKDWLAIEYSGCCMKLTNPRSQSTHAGLASCGYGLEICRRICQQQGWTLETESSAEYFSATVDFAPKP